MSLFKLEGAPETRLCDVVPEKPSTEIKICVSCRGTCGEEKFECETCKSGCYCSKVCRDKHVKLGEHQILCVSIQQLEDLQVKNRLKALPLKPENQVPIKGKLVSSVGEKPIVKCQLGGQSCEALWDTGAQVSLINKSWLQSNHPTSEILSLEEFLEGDSMHLFAANSSKVEIEGVVTLMFNVGGFSVSVPFIVSNSPLSHPIIGFNVIQHLVFEGGDNSCELLKLSCPTVSEANVVAVVNLIKNNVFKEDFIITSKENVIPPNSRCKIKCRTN